MIEENTRGEDQTRRSGRRAPAALWASLAVGLPALLLGCATTHGASPQAHASAAEAPRPDARPPALASREVNLSDWGLSGVDALSYARVGVLHQERPALVIYHLGASDPQANVEPGATSARPELDRGAFLIAHYDHENKNLLGGYFNGFARAPARATVAIDDDGLGESALVFDFDKRPGTFAGFWIHLFETGELPTERTYLDTSGVDWLTFEIRGAVGGESIRVQLADRDWERRQDSLPLGELDSFLPSGRVERGWQRAWIPLSALPKRLDRRRLAGLVFLVDPDGGEPRRGRIYLRDMLLSTTRGLPSRLAEEAPDPAPAMSAPGARTKAMWLWETARLLATPGELDALSAFVTRHHFTDLFVQIPYRDRAEGERHWSAHWDRAGVRRLVARLSEVGVRVHALDGAAWYARPSWHDRVVETVRSVAAYNAESAPDERLCGVRFDIEPYLLPEFAGDNRAVVLGDYLTLLRRVVAITRQAGLELGVDIPFWFDARDEITGALAAPVEGRSAAEAIIDIADEIGIMDYRTTAYGADGVLAHAEGELSYASARGKRVLIGLETVPLPDETIFIYDGGGRSRWDITGDLVIEPLGGARARVTFVPRNLRRRDGAYAWAAPGSKLMRQQGALEVPASKITFATLGPTDLERTIRRARPEFERYPSFSGFIIHSYESYRRWLGEAGGDEDATVAAESTPAR